MTNIFELAKKAGFGISNQYETPEVLDGDGYGLITNEIKKFADLVRSDEREKCKKICGGYADSLRLAAKLGIEVGQTALGNVFATIDGVNHCVRPINDDLCEATRSAIEGLAAEIGKEKE